MRVSVLLAAALFVVTGPCLVSLAVADDVCDRGTPDAAIAACTRAIEDSRTSTEKRSKLYNNRGAAFGRKGQPDRAIEDFDEAIRLNPDFAEAFFNRGIAYANNGQTDHAIQDYDQAIRLNPNHAEAFYNRGYSYADKRQSDRAIQDYDEAIRLNPNYAEAFHNRGIAYGNK